MTNRRNGFALLGTLVLTIALFLLVSLAFSANYRLHQQNRLMLRDVQTRADGIRVE